MDKQENFALSNDNVITPPPQPTKKSECIEAQSYWDSPKVKSLFGPRNAKRVLNTIHCCLKILREAVATYDRYNSIIDDFSSPDGSNCSDFVKLSNFNIFLVFG